MSDLDDLRRRLRGLADSRLIGHSAAVDAMNAIERLERDLAAAREETRRLREIAADLHDDDECWFDHHGYCQTHGWMDADTKCPHARARAVLAETEADDG